MRCHVIRRLATQSTVHSSFFRTISISLLMMIQIILSLVVQIAHSYVRKFPGFYIMIFLESLLNWLSFSSHRSICGKTQGSQNVQKLIKTSFTTE